MKRQLYFATAILLVVNSHGSEKRDDLCFIINMTPNVFDYLVICFNIL